MFYVYEMCNLVRNSDCSVPIFNQNYLNILVVPLQIKLLTIMIKVSTYFYLFKIPYTVQDIQ